MAEDNGVDESAQVCPMHYQFVSNQKRLCDKVDWIIKLIITNLIAVVLTLISLLCGLTYLLLKIPKI